MTRDGEPPEVRAAGLDDAPALARLLTELGFPATADEVVPRLGRMLAQGPAPLVAEVGGEVLGMLTWSIMHVLHRPGPVARISTLVVRDSVRGRGIGRALVHAAEAQGRAAGCILMEVTSNTRLTAAHAFYERLDYQRTSFRFAKNLG